MNVKEEFLEHIKDRRVECVSIVVGKEWNEDKEFFNLKRNYTESDYVAFLDRIDFNYDNGYGGQEIFGTIWYEDGTWSDRGEYDGSEWWQHQSRPDIPEELK